MKKTVSLCSKCSSCPEVKIHDNGYVEVGEAGNLCILTREEWETLKQKILAKEI